MMPNTAQHSLDPALADSESSSWRSTCLVPILISLGLLLLLGLIVVGRSDPDADTYRQMARTFQSQGQLTAAVDALEAAYRLRPQSILLAKELAVAYELADQASQADQMWAALGLSAGTMVDLGDFYLNQTDLVAAAAWYQRAVRSNAGLRDSLAFRQAVLEIVLDQRLPPADQASPLTIHPLAHDLRIRAGELRLMPSGDSLAFTSYLESSYIQHNGAAIVAVEVAESGRYQVTLRMIDTPPSPVMVWLQQNLQSIATYELARGDMSVIELPVELELTVGPHILGVYYFNDHEIPGVEDRNAFIVDIRFTRLP